MSPFQDLPFPRVRTAGFRLAAGSVKATRRFCAGCVGVRVLGVEGFGAFWLNIDERGEMIWNPMFLDFAPYWGFTPRLCPAYRAQTRGKVESGVK